MKNKEYVNEAVDHLTFDIIHQLTTNTTAQNAQNFLFVRTGEFQVQVLHVNKMTHAITSRDVRHFPLELLNQDVLI